MAAKINYPIHGTDFQGTGEKYTKINVYGLYGDPSWYNNDGWVNSYVNDLNQGGNLAIQGDACRNGGIINCCRIFGDSNDERFTNVLNSKDMLNCSMSVPGVDNNNIAVWGRYNNGVCTVNDIKTCKFEGGSCGKDTDCCSPFFCGIDNTCQGPYYKPY